MIDVDHQISAVERTVGDRVLAAGSTRVMTASRLEFGPGAMGVGWDLALMGSHKER